MKTRFWKFLAAGIISCSAQQAMAQQHPVYAQYLFNGMVVNPAYPSMDEFSSATVVARNQWLGMEGAPKTGTFSFYSPLKATNTSIGFLAMQDKITIYSQTGVHLNISQKVKLNKKLTLAMGLKGGMEQFRENNTHLATDDPVFAQDQRYWKTDIGFGFMLYSEKFFVGLSAPSFHNFDIGNSVNKVAFKRHMYLHGGMILDVNKDIKFRPGLLFRQVGGAGVQMDVNASFLFKDLVWVGATWRTEKTAAAMVQLQIAKSLQLGYAYDFASASYLKGMQNGSHELMLNYRFSLVKGKTLTPRMF
ncbi:PorP/SprF family type IX secretion system membrane protein [Chitinophaga cymbidii]|uniref:Membrane protein n=1 Tax=Chitinophaga cymbidii TaxID=1096750 RepID=A0A512RSV6_9BACT|nr:type IX secretion system membrane protein PorP/SprF [Chitinophaga cymbidii]GEP98764.1 membrane protein [Chitinophaga cymbidii]